MANFLRLLAESRDKPARMIFMNSGVRLVCEGSIFLTHLKKLEEQGVELLACTTCLEYFGLEEKLKAGLPTTMARTIESLLQGRGRQYLAPTAVIDFGWLAARG